MNILSRVLSGPERPAAPAIGPMRRRPLRVEGAIEHDAYPGPG